MKNYKTGLRKINTPILWPSAIAMITDKPCSILFSKQNSFISQMYFECLPKALCYARSLGFTGNLKWQDINLKFSKRRK